jgi:4-oxalocrotonate tautomerase
MPHLVLKYYPRDLSDSDKSEMASDLAQVLKKHLGTQDESISIEMTEVAPDKWKNEVYDPYIWPSLDKLIK